MAITQIGEWSEWIYMLDENWIHKMSFCTDNLINNLDNQIVEAFKWYPLSNKGKDIVWRAVREKKAIIKANHEWTIVGDPWVHYLIVNCEWWIVESFDLETPVSEILGGKWETDDEIEKLCNIFTSMWVKVNRQSM